MGATVAAGLFLGAVTALGGTAWARRDSLPPPRPADAIVVLSGDGDLGRARRAGDLFAARLAPWVVATGRGVGGDDAAWEADRLVERGIPRERILLEHSSTSTDENLRFSVPLLLDHGCRSVLVVTSPFHALRARLAARRIFRPNGIEARVVSAESRGGAAGNPPSLWGSGMLYLSEWAKIVRDLLSKGA